MTEVDENRLIRAVAGLLPDERRARRVCNRAADEHEQLARKARWALERARARGCSFERTASFEEGYLAAWSDFYLYAAHAHGGARLLAPDVEPGTVYLTWHMPEYPLLLGHLRRFAPLVLIAQDADWMTRSLGEENLLPFRPQLDMSRLAEGLAARRPIAAMIDYCYDETRHVETPFLGYPARTPSGLFVLAARCDYAVCVAGVRDGVAVELVRLDPVPSDPVECAAAVNTAVESEICADPSRWLLWPSVDRRWSGVDYNEPIAAPALV